jgi:hypothetical protein
VMLHLCPVKSRPRKWHDNTAQPSDEVLDAPMGAYSFLHSLPPRRKAASTSIISLDKRYQHSSLIANIIRYRSFDSEFRARISKADS